MSKSTPKKLEGMAAAGELQLKQLEAIAAYLTGPYANQPGYLEMWGESIRGCVALLRRLTPPASFNGILPRSFCYWCKAKIYNGPSGVWLTPFTQKRYCSASKDNRHKPDPFLETYIQSISPASPSPAEGQGQKKGCSCSLCGMIADKLDNQKEAEAETPCPARADQLHCNCWYDGMPCCACGDNGAATGASSAVGEQGLAQQQKCEYQDCSRTDLHEHFDEEPPAAQPGQGVGSGPVGQDERFYLCGECGKMSEPCIHFANLGSVTKGLQAAGSGERLYSQAEMDKALELSVTVPPDILTEMLTSPLCGVSPTTESLGLKAAILGGCGEKIADPRKCFKCVDCQVPFHKECLAKHCNSELSQARERVTELEQQLHRAEVEIEALNKEIGAQNE